LQDKVLKPVGEGFEWSWTQHTAWLTGYGTLTVFDNGWGRDFAPTKLSGNYSRAVEYKVDEAKGTVEQVWQYGKEQGDEWYSPITSVVAYRADTDTQFIYSASVNYLTPEKLTTTVLNEVRRGSQGGGGGVESAQPPAGECGVSGIGDRSRQGVLIV
jgi:arylsulfate sulfotransferase